VIFGAPALLVLFFYAYRYLSAARRMRRGGQVFVYEVWDGLALMGKPATARGLTILGWMCIVAPIAIALVFAKDQIANGIATLRSPCKSLLPATDANAAMTGPGVHMEHAYTSRFSCSTSYRDVSDATLTIDVMSMPSYSAKGFREDRERHGAKVVDTAFGAAGQLATQPSGADADEATKRANQDFERRLAAPRQPSKSASPMDSWLDSLPFRGAEVYTLVPCSGRNVSVSIRATGANADDVIAKARDHASPRLTSACTLAR